MKVSKPISKRTPVRLRHKIQKASAAKQRKARKEEKKNPQWKSRVKKDPGIPNLFPFKAKLLAEIEEKKRLKEEETLKRREVAKAQRRGEKVEEGTGRKREVVIMEEEGDDDVESDGMEVEDTSNPMAALLASAQARANAYEKDEVVEEEEEREEWGGIHEASVTAAKDKALPKKALEDPVKAVTKLVAKMRASEDAMARMMEFYGMPPLVMTGNDFTTRYLVEVARKRGRLGRGGVPNLHSAALTVLSDLHEGRLVLPAVETPKVAATAAGDKGEVQIVKTKAEPFRLEGLWGDEAVAASEMEVEQ